MQPATGRAPRGGRLSEPQARKARAAQRPRRCPVVASAEGPPRLARLDLLHDGRGRRQRSNASWGDRSAKAPGGLIRVSQRVARLTPVLQSR